MALSDLAVRQAKATGKAYTLPDLDGLSLAVTAAGGRTWHFRYYWAGKQKRMSLGTYPAVTLREARSLHDEARPLPAKGINPRVHRKHKGSVVRLAGENTFEAVYRKWLKHRGLSLKAGRQTTLSRLPRTFEGCAAHLGQAVDRSDQASRPPGGDRQDREAQGALRRAARRPLAAGPRAPAAAAMWGGMRWGVGGVFMAYGPS